MKSTDIIKASANSLNIYSFTAEALERLIESVKAGQPCQTCEALARTVMLDQTSHDAQRKPLTHEQRVDLLAKFEAHKHEWHAPAILIDMVEAAHGITGEK